jgi:superfamily II DNA or RNA helicase
MKQKTPSMVSSKKSNPKKMAPLFEITDEYRETVRNHSYIGKKGYTIHKSVLSKEDDAFLRKDLFVKPEISGAQFGGLQFGEDLAFPVYRESPQKMYIPRFYGIKRYGLPPKCDIEPGENADFVFSKPLRDYQEKIVDIYIGHTQTPICMNSSNRMGNGAILEVPCGRGKTVIALKIISVLKKKALILVHKEFLMNQWIERIEEFLPNAKVGKIKGKTVDVENKDIVIGMIQTIYDKENLQSLFSQFGITVIDEVHRIGSEQFSRTLLKTVTPYMLGISATVERKDKLTKLLYMFIGEKIYTEKRENDDFVCVRGIEYRTNDAEFNDTYTDYKGNTQYSKMIVKLCDYGPRSDFIVRVIGDLIEENPDNQIMILGHNRTLLTYLHDAIQHKNIGTVGYYVGGMKQADLQETEKRQIVVATYSMAAEALDIKTLSTLVMVTPKTDITQSVGRILRVKHENPIIVDIIDTHSVFQKQWKQRERFYKKCNYRIRTTHSNIYSTMSIDWDRDMSWKKVFEPKEIKASDSEDSEKEENILDKKPNIIGKCLISLDDL